MSSVRGLKIRTYAPEDSKRWNDFVAKSRNGTFLHNRGFMEYHSDRFNDASLMVERDGKLLAIMPANLDNDTLFSHGGLTYGGIIVGRSMGTALMCDVVDAILTDLSRMGILRLVYKPAPHFYHNAPTEEDIYALVQAGGTLVQCDASAAIALKRPLTASQSRRQGAKRAAAAGITVRESRDWTAFWGVLEIVLSSRHEVQPTHSLTEIRLLAERFPENIRLFGAYQKDELLAGVVVFDCGRTVHVQYMANHPDKRMFSGLDLILLSLIGETFANRDWFDFGISTTEGGAKLNSGLAQQKEMFGARCVLYNRYEVSL
ncbi:GNAT family N-acetyltransferase [Gymnodinialimonas sp. 57CJ19]|uniref:GNAT family N-acetyltransferase n=1 Tax=Gymnodinialimonas sp. 57CJ19 TaxID=3138498 RepID=UPI0031345005